jgi:hypothetical protein
VRRPELAEMRANHKGGTAVGKRHARQELHPTLGLKTVIALIVVVVGLLLLVLAVSR